MVKLSLSSWLNPSSTTRDEAVATAERKKQNRRTFSGFSSQQQKSSKGADGKAAAAATLQEKQASLQPKDSHPSLSSAASTSAVEPNSNQYDAMASTTSMTALADIISKETAKLEKYMKENNLPMPSFQVDAADDFPKLPNDMQRSRLTIMHATKQLRDLTVGPRESLRWGVWEFLDVVALQIINNYGLAKLVPMDKPISLADLATQTPLDPVNLARTLRTAMTNHIFHEPEPGLVAHTAASRLLATDSELAAWIGFNAEDIFPAAGGVLSALHQFPEATSLTRSGFQVTFNTVDIEPMFATFGKDAARARRMGQAMASLTGGEGYEVSYFVDAYDFSDVDARGGTFVDVGGSHGFVCVDLARKWKNMRFVVQDLQKTVDSAPNPVCEDDEQVNKRVEFVAHDFFTEQKVQADVYYFRWIMHNYSTPYAISILKNLLPSLKPGARVIINDHCLRETGQENPWDEKIMRRMDMVMLTLLNAQERTEAEFRELFRQVDEGFVFKGVTRPQGCRMSIIEAVWKPEEAAAATAAAVEPKPESQPETKSEDTTKDA